MPQIERDYISTGKVRYVLRDFPIAGLHPQAFKAHEAARCAGDQGKYWEMHSRLFASQRAVAPADLEAHAQALGLNVDTFRQCVSTEKHAAAIRKDLEEGATAGVGGTPTFFLGVTERNSNKLKASKVIVGSQPYERFKEAIEALLQQPAGQTR